MKIGAFPKAGLLLLLASGIAMALLGDSRGGNSLGVRDLRAEYQPGGYRLRATASSEATFRIDDELSRPMSRGAWQSHWLPLPRAERRTVRLHLSRHRLRLDIPVLLDPTQAEAPYHLALPDNGWETLGVDEWPLLAEGWDGLEPHEAARRARFAVPMIWDLAGWVPEGAVLPGEDPGAPAGLALSVHVVSGNPGGARVVTTREETLLLGGPAWVPTPVVGPRTLRVFFPRAWIDAHGAPLRLLPPEDEKLWGQLRGVHLAAVGGEPKGTRADLVDLLLEFRSYAGMVLGGWLPGRTDRVRITVLGHRIRELLEVEGDPDNSQEDVVSFYRVVLFVEALFELRATAELPPVLADYRGPLRYRGVLAAFQRSRKGDPLKLLGDDDTTGQLRAIRKKFARTLGPRHAGWVAVLASRFQLLEKSDSSSVTLLTKAPTIAAIRDLQQIRPTGADLLGPPSAHARIPALALMGRIPGYGGKPLAKVIPEGVARLRDLSDWIEGLPDTAERDADHELVRNILGVAAGGGK